MASRGSASPGRATTWPTRRASWPTRVRQETGMPLALGFGLSRPEHVRAVSGFADAAVVGQRAGQRDRGARPVAGAARRSRTVRAMAEELSLEALREEIDKIDEVIVRLLDRRARCAYAIGRIKSEQRLPIYEPQREADGHRACQGAEHQARRPARRTRDRAALRTHHGRGAPDSAHRGEARARAAEPDDFVERE